MVRSTSIEAYKDLLEDDNLSEKHKNVLAYLIRANNKEGALSASELFNRYMKSDNLPFSNIRARLGELRDMGAIEERGKRNCSITGKKVIQWHYTGDKTEGLNRTNRKSRLDLIHNHLNVIYTEAKGNPKLREDLKILWKMIKEY